LGDSLKAIFEWRTSRISKCSLQRMLGLGKATFGFEVIGRDLKFIALFEPVYKDLFMFNQTQIQLVHEYNCFSGRFSDENDEDIERQQRFHKHVSKR
jgi:hypothetical protein